MADKKKTTARAVAAHIEAHKRRRTKKKSLKSHNSNVNAMNALEKKLQVVQKAIGKSLEKTSDGDLYKRDRAAWDRATKEQEALYEKQFVLQEKMAALRNPGAAAARQRARLRGD
jgi:hypothetical protein